MSFLSYTYKKFSSHLTENILRVHYKFQLKRTQCNAQDADLNDKK